MAITYETEAEEKTSETGIQKIFDEKPKPFREPALHSLSGSLPCVQMKTETKRLLKDLIETYDRTTRVMEHGAAKAIEEEGRAYGGFIRSAKGKMQEYITNQIIHIAWASELGKDVKRLSVNSEKVPIPIKMEYVNEIQDATIKDYILSNIKRYYYGLSVDKHVSVDGKFILELSARPTRKTQ